MKVHHISLFFLIFLFFFIQINSEEISISLDDIETNVENDKYQIASKVLNLNTNNEYKISGSCTECKIKVNQKTDMTITLNSISLSNSNDGPFIIGKSAKVNLILEGESTISDDEDITKDDTEEIFEGAGIKFKSSSSLVISGTGKLTVIGTPKNGIKGAKKSSLTINGGTLSIKAAKNALACDNLITINDGTIEIESDSDGIKSEPDSDDDESKGTIIINGGNINIISKSDAIQAAYNLEINGGIFNIKTYEGADSETFDKDTMSAKGLKCSTNEHENVTNVLNINGGEFHLDTSDDSVHSDYNITITKGIFEIKSGDDSIHADQYLILGEKDETDNSLLNIKIEKSYEGLEGSQVYIYSGTYNIIASDDGINSAGDTDDNCQNGGGMGPGGNQGGMGPGGNQGGMGPGGNQGGMGPGGNNERPMRNLRKRSLQPNQMSNQCYIFHIYIYGGDIYVNTESDGLDANGNIYIYGGNLEVWGMKSGGDGDPIDLDGTLYILGGTVLAGGSSGMNPLHQYANTIAQNFIYETNSYSTNKEISIKSGDNLIKAITIPKTINYLFYTSKETDSNYKFSEGTTNYKAGATSVDPENTGNQGTGNFPGNQGNQPQFPGNNGSPTQTDENANDSNNKGVYLFNKGIIVFILGFIIML